MALHAPTVLLKGSVSLKIAFLPGSAMLMKVGMEAPAGQPARPGDTKYVSILLKMQHALLPLLISPHWRNGA